MLTVSIFVFSYKVALLKHCTKALHQSSRVSLRTDARGFLSMQFMISCDNDQVCFIEYFVSLHLPLSSQHVFIVVIVSNHFQCAPDEVVSGEE